MRGMVGEDQVVFELGTQCGIWAVIVTVMSKDPVRESCLIDLGEMVGASRWYRRPWRSSPSGFNVFSCYVAGLAHTSKYAICSIEQVERRIEFLQVGDYIVSTYAQRFKSIEHSAFRESRSTHRNPALVHHYDSLVVNDCP